jgi:hypothetical protein
MNTVVFPNFAHIAQFENYYFGDMRLIYLSLISPDFQISFAEGVFQSRSALEELKNRRCGKLSGWWSDRSEGRRRDQRLDGGSAEPVRVIGQLCRSQTMGER